MRNQQRREGQEREKKPSKSIISGKILWKVTSVHAVIELLDFKLHSWLLPKQCAAVRLSYSRTIQSFEGPQGTFDPLCLAHSPPIPEGRPLKRVQVHAISSKERRAGKGAQRRDLGGYGQKIFCPATLALTREVSVQQWAQKEN